MQNESRDSSAALLHRTLIAPGWIILALAVIVGQLAPALPPWVRYGPFFLSVILFGLPHGATDHLVPRRLRPKNRRRSRQILFFAGYLGAGGAYVALWYAAPLAAAIAFLLLTWFHWGQGDLHALRRQLGATYLRTSRLRLLALLLRGALPMVVPLAAFPATYRATLDSLAGLFTSDVATGWIETPVIQTGAAALVGLLALAYLGATWRAVNGRRERQVWVRDLLEVGLLILLFATVEPLLSIGLYFCFWHSTRHIARLLLIDADSRQLLERGRFMPALGRFFRDAAPLSVAALLLGALLSVLIPYADVSVDGVLALYLVLIAALTLPHTGVVSWMDRQQV